MPLTRRQALLGTSAALATIAGSAGCAALDEQQRRWIFQPATGTWGGGLDADGEVWIAYTDAAGDAVRLHGHWLPQPDPRAPLALYLHGARWNLASSAGRMRRVQALGFSVLGIDYRGFGQSTDTLPSEDRAHEDALAAWRWLGAKAPGLPRYVYGHSLGGAIGVRLAAEAAAAGEAPAGLVVEGSFPSIPELVSTFRYGWLPVGPLITQRFEAARHIARVASPVIVVHGSADRLVPAELGRRLYERAAGPKRFVLVEGGTHHDASRAGFDAVRAAVGELFGVRPSAA